MRNGNPNAPANPYATKTYGQAQPGQTNNPASYAQQRNAGQTAPQPNTYGYGGGTNTNTYGRGGQTVAQPAPLNPTPVAPIPAPVVSPWQQQPANWNGGAYTVNGTTYNPAGFSNYSGPQWADPLATYQQQNGPVSPQWWQNHIQGAGFHPNGSISYGQPNQQNFQMPQMNGGGNNPFGGGSNPWSSIGERFGY